MTVSFDLLKLSVSSKQRIVMHVMMTIMEKQSHRFSQRVELGNRLVQLVMLIHVNTWDGKKLLLLCTDYVMQDLLFVQAML